jgi:signal transduction histidine kinase
VTELVILSLTPRSLLGFLGHQLMPTGKWPILALAIVPAAADLLAALASHSVFWPQFAQGLYYAAIVIAGLEFGWKVGLGLACFAGVAHSLIANLLLSSSIVSLQAQVLAFLVVGFALIEERRRATARLTRARAAEPVSTGAYLESQVCVEQVFEIAFELIREIRTPLASIEGAAFILQENGLDGSKSAEFFDIIRKECRRVKHTLTEISACTEVLPLHFQATDMGSMLAEVVHLAAREVPDPAIAIRTEVDSNLPRVWCDKTQILNLIVPFVVRAMQSMPDGGEIMLAVDQKDGLARIQLKVLRQTLRASHVAQRGDLFTSVYDTAADLRLLSARRTLLQHGGSISVDRTGTHKMLSSMTIPLYNGQR